MAVLSARQRSRPWYLRAVSKAAFLRVVSTWGNPMFQALQRGRVLVLCYHRVVPDGTPDPQQIGDVVSTSEFAAQLDVLRRDFDPISVADFAQWFAGAGQLPSRPVLVTFDDGYRNNLTYAAPLLHAYGVPALVFLTTGYIGTDRLLWPYEIQERILCWRAYSLPLPDGKRVPLPPNPKERVAVAAEVRELCKRLRFELVRDYLELLSAGSEPGESRKACEFMSWDDVREWVRLGFDVGSHTIEHPVLSRISEDQLSDELERSKAIIEREVGRPCPYFAYPNGRRVDFTLLTAKALHTAKYEFAFTTVPSFISPTQNPLMLGRVCVPTHPSLDLFRTHISMLHSTAKRWLGAAA